MNLNNVRAINDDLPLTFGVRQERYEEYEQRKAREWKEINKPATVNNWNCATSSDNPPAPKKVAAKKLDSKKASLPANVINPLNLEVGDWVKIEPWDLEMSPKHAFGPITQLRHNGKVGRITKIVLDVGNGTLGAHIDCAGVSDYLRFDLRRLSRSNLIEEEDEDEFAEGTKVILVTPDPSSEEYEGKCAVVLAALAGNVVRVEFDDCRVKVLYAWRFRKA